MAHGGGGSHNEKLTGSQQMISGMIDLIAGTAGGTANVLVGQPLDTVKVKMQAFPQLYPNTVQCFTKTLRTDGIRRGLYAGTLPALAANIAENSVLFCAYGFCQQGVQQIVGKAKVSELNALENASAGFLAAFFSSLTLCPTELVKCQLQALRESNAANGNITAFGLTKEIWREHGFRGFFKGLTPTFAREMPGYFFFFGGYEITRAWLTPEGKTKEDIGALRTIVAGGVGGTCLWVSIFPADVIKSRMQISKEKLSVIQVCRSILKTEGALAFYNGLIPTVLRTFPSTGALFLAYEYTRKGLNQLLLPELANAK